MIRSLFGSVRVKRRRGGTYCDEQEKRIGEVSGAGGAVSIGTQPRFGALSDFRSAALYNKRRANNCRSAMLPPAPKRDFSGASLCGRHLKAYTLIFQNKCFIL